MGRHLFYNEVSYVALIKGFSSVSGNGLQSPGQIILDKVVPRLIEAAVRLKENLSGRIPFLKPLSL